VNGEQFNILQKKAGHYLLSLTIRRIPIVFPIHSASSSILIVQNQFAQQGRHGTAPSPSVATSDSSSSYPPRMTNVPFFFLRRIWL
jgi:hypothetical protein